MLRDSLKELSSNDPLRLAGATAFFTTFALPPILIILILVLGLIFDRRNISRQIFDRLETMLGKATVDQLIATLRGFREMAENPLLTIGLLIFLIFVATTLFKVIKASLNQIWKIRVEEKRNVGQRLKARLQSFLVILFTGLLFLASLVGDATQVFLGRYISAIWPEIMPYFNNALNYVLSVLVVTMWFIILFRYLPDARLSWKVSFVGGLFTSILFNIGKLVMGYLLIRGNISSLYGASGSLVLLLLFVFYSSFILYFGAAFTKIWAYHRSDPIKPLSYAIHYKQVHVELEKGAPDAER